VGGFVKKRIVISFLLLTLGACSSVIKPISTEILISTAVPTQTATVIPTMTFLSSDEMPDVISELASEWNGIPIMPGEIAGEGDQDGYVFTIEATPQTVQEYYQLELGNLGWQLLSQEADDSSILLMFVNGASETLTIHVIAKDGEALVLLVK
jgi:hypothetical protein